jgi:hypothetical protein
MLVPNRPRQYPTQPLCDSLHQYHHQRAIRTTRRCSDGFFVFVFQASKIIGATSEADWSFEAVLKLGQVVTGAIVSIACTLDHCHVLERSEYFVISLKAVEIGLGLHNEPVSTCICLDNPVLREFGSLTLNLHFQNFSSGLLKLILDMDDPERASVPFSPSDHSVLLSTTWVALARWRCMPLLMKLSCN